MSGKYIAAMIAFLGGSVIAVINAIITAKQINSEQQSLSSASVIRQILAFAYLAGTYFAVRKIGIELMWPMMGAAVGLTVPSILFAITIAKHMKGDD